jgi:hypothetical protein
MESVFRIVLPSELTHIEIVLVVGPPFTFPKRKSVNFRPDHGCPILLDHAGEF